MAAKKEKYAQVVMEKTTKNEKFYGRLAPRKTFIMLALFGVFIFYKKI